MISANQKKVCDIILLMELSGKVNHTKAYQMVFGCKKKTAEASASRMLRNVNISAYLTRARARVKRAVEKTEAEIIREYEKLAFVVPGDLYNNDGTPKELSKLTSDQKAAIKVRSVTREYVNKKGKKGKTVEVSFGTQPKKAALDSLAKIKGIMRQDVTINVDEETATLLRMIDGTTKGKLPGAAEEKEAE